MRDDNPQFVRLAERDRPKIGFLVDGEPAHGMQGDTLLTALLLNGCQVRQSEFGDGPRAGFCNMGACQDCWVDLADGERARACTVYLTEGMHVLLQGRS